MPQENKYRLPPGPPSMCELCPSYRRCAAEPAACYDFAVWVADGEEGQQSRVPTPAIFDLIHESGRYAHLAGDSRYRAKQRDDELDRLLCAQVEPEPANSAPKKRGAPRTLDDDQIRDIYRIRGKEPQSRTAFLYSVSQQLVNAIQSGKRHAAVTGAQP